LVPFLDLRAQCRGIKPDVDAAVSRAIESSLFVLGSEVANFEKLFADYLDDLAKWWRVKPGSPTAVRQQEAAAS
jgi:hypothetical protein